MRLAADFHIRNKTFQPPHQFLGPFARVITLMLLQLRVRLQLVIPDDQTRQPELQLVFPLVLPLTQRSKRPVCLARQGAGVRRLGQVRLGGRHLTGSTERGPGA